MTVRSGHNLDGIATAQADDIYEKREGSIDVRHQQQHMPETCVARYERCPGWRRERFGKHEPSYEQFDPGTIRAFSAQQTVYLSPPGKLPVFFRRMTMTAQAFHHRVECFMRIDFQPDVVETRMVILPDRDTPCPFVGAKTQFLLAIYRLKTEQIRAETTPLGDISAKPGIT